MAKLLGALALYSRIWNNYRTVAVCTNGKITRSTRSLFENLNIHKNQGFVSRFCEGSREQLLIIGYPVITLLYRAQGPIDRACV